MSKYNEDIDYLIYLIYGVDISKKELNEIIAEADRIISDTNSKKDKLIEAYLKKVQCLQKLDRYDDSKKIIDELLILNPNMPEALVRLGNFYDENKEYDNAIDCVNKAIALKKDYAYAYCMRGYFYSVKKDYDKASQDYSVAILYKPDFALTYTYRGVTKYHLFDYSGAIKDCTKSIEINPNYAAAYNNRGIVKHKLLDYDGAIKDYAKATKINPNYAKAYYNRGITYNRIKKHKKAATDFSKAETDIFSVLIMTDGEKIANFMLDYDTFFKKETKAIEKKKIENYKDIYIRSLKIILKLQVEDELEMPVSHYTKKDVSERLLFDDYPKNNDVRDYFRLYSVNTSNDPEEGKTLFRYLFSQENISSKVEEFGAFAGCFILNNDSLNQFRLYGKTEDKEEGTGVSIALNKHFFEKEIKDGIDMNLKNKKEGDSPNLSPLFHCIYIDPKTKKVISLGQKEEYVFYRENKTKDSYQKYKKKIDETLKKISEELEQLKEQIKKKKLDSDIVYKLLLYLRYLVKHTAFRGEQECRIIQIKMLADKEKVKLDDNNRLFVKYSKLDSKNVSEICFAPKAKDIDKFKQHLARNNYSVKCDKSKAPLA
jgi:lipoprotein NlpI